MTPPDERFRLDLNPLKELSRLCAEGKLLKQGRFEPWKTGGGKTIEGMRTPWMYHDCSPSSADDEGGDPPVFTIDCDDDADPVFQMIEIGPFGRPEHNIACRELTDTWEDNEGHIQLRRFQVPAENFIVTSGELPIYFFDGINGLWLGSELIRRRSS